MPRWQSPTARSSCRFAVTQREARTRNPSFVERVPVMRLNTVLLRSTVVAALGGLLFGFDTVVISGTTQALTELFRLTPLALGVTVSSALVGTILGSMLAGIPGDAYGRRDSLRILAILYFISAIGCGFAWNWTALVIFRVIGGLAIGGSSVL